MKKFIISLGLGVFFVHYAFALTKTYQVRISEYKKEVYRLEILDGEDADDSPFTSHEFSPRQFRNPALINRIHILAAKLEEALNSGSLSVYEVMPYLVSTDWPERILRHRFRPIVEAESLNRFHVEFGTSELAESPKPFLLSIMGPGISDRKGRPVRTGSGIAASALSDYEISRFHAAAKQIEIALNEGKISMADLTAELGKKDWQRSLFKSNLGNTISLIPLETFQVRVSPAEAFRTRDRFSMGFIGPGILNIARLPTRYSTYGAQEDYLHPLHLTRAAQFIENGLNRGEVSFSQIEAYLRLPGEDYKTQILDVCCNGLRQIGLRLAEKERDHLLAEEEKDNPAEAEGSGRPFAVREAVAAQ